MLSANGVTIRFGKRVLFEDVNINFNKGNLIISEQVIENIKQVHKSNEVQKKKYSLENKKSKNQKGKRFEQVLKDKITKRK